jgi:predicted DNA-binding antitoxin AbrB/MazE fold protein
MNVIEAVVRNGHIVPNGNVELEEGAKVHISYADDQDQGFWLSATEESLKEIWDNEEDDVCAELLSK